MMQKTTTPEASPGDASGASSIDAAIERHGDWRGEMPARIRALVKEAVPDVIEVENICGNS